MSRCSSAKVFGGSGCLRGVHGCQTFGGLRRAGLKLRIPTRAKVDLSGHNPRAFAHQAVALAVGPLGVLFGNGWHTRHAAMARSPRSHPKNPA